MSDKCKFLICHIYLFYNCKSTTIIWIPQTIAEIFSLLPNIFTLGKANKFVSPGDALTKLQIFISLFSSCRIASLPFPPIS